jgi:cobyrinic acid a,c-diamide synthase
LLNCLIQQTLQNRQSYSDVQKRHIGLEPAKENKNKCDYLTKAVTLSTTPVSDEELIDFLKQMQIATFGIVTVHKNNNHEDNISQDELSYFVYIRLIDSVHRGCRIKQIQTLNHYVYCVTFVFVALAAKTSPKIDTHKYG